MVALGQWQSREVALITSAKPLDLTSREPLLPGGFSRGAVVWAAEDIYFVGGILVVKKHTQRAVLPTRLTLAPRSSWR